MTENIDNQIKQIDEIIPPDRVLKTLNGENVKVPLITLGKELKILRKFFEILKSGGYKDATGENQSIDTILLNALCNNDGNKLILDMFALIVGKPPDWLIENVDITSMAECLLPFFVTRVKALTKVMASITDMGMDTLN